MSESVRLWKIYFMRAHEKKVKSDSVAMKERHKLDTHCIRPHHCGPRSRCLRRTAIGPGCRYTPRMRWPHMWSGSSHTNTQHCPELLQTYKYEWLELQLEQELYYASVPHASI